ncbi:hypothetical protein [Streptomyces sp. NPDC056323]|uniref:hypothetical protein n=1 Tax=Streptomyces sp. NPDC056323 TaxID=3345784 RepID=UPI0035D82355
MIRTLPAPDRRGIARSTLTALAVAAAPFVPAGQAEATTTCAPHTTGVCRAGSAHLDEQSGSVAASGVLGRVQKGFTVPAVLVTLGVFGIVLTLVGIGLGIWGYTAGRTARRPLAAVPPWPAV